MLRQRLLSELQAFEETWAQCSLHSSRQQMRDQDMVAKFKAFVGDNPKCFERSNLPGHITGSVLITNSSLDRVLLTHHRKLGLWLQLGGHCDGESDCSKVALTEGYEESGLKRLAFFRYEPWVFGSHNPTIDQFRPIPFDLDSHLISKISKGS